MKICQAVANCELNRDCVFDVATTGDKTVANAYLVDHDRVLHDSSVQILADNPRTRLGEPVMITATVLTLSSDAPKPSGTVTLLVDGTPAGTPVTVDERGRASFAAEHMKRGPHTFRAVYGGGGNDEHRASSSPTLLHSVG